MRRNIGIVLAVVGVVGVVGSFVWQSVAEPRLIRYPTDLDETPEYAGTVSIYLDPVTYAPLDPPIEAPLDVRRHLLALGDESSSSRVVLSETISVTAEGQFSGELDAQYVMDRRTIANVDDDRAWAFNPDNLVDRSPAYRLAFPFDTKAEPTLVYKNEVATTYEAQPAGEAQVEGLDVIRFTADQSTPLPVSPAYLAALRELTRLPSELTLEQLHPILRQVGVDIDVLLPALLPSLAPEDTTALLELASRPVPLVYLFTFAGEDTVEPSTGSVVEVSDVVETLYAAPEPAVVSQLKEILGRYPAVPAAVDGVAGLDRLSVEPVKVFENRFTQTPASVEDIAATVKDAKSLKRLAETIVPNSLLIGGAILFVAGLALALVGRRRSPDRTEAAPTQDL